MTDQDTIAKLNDENRQLRALLEKERAGLARFLVPWRRQLDASWLRHFEKECGVFFDEIGYVKPRPVQITPLVRAVVERDLPETKQLKV